MQPQLPCASPYDHHQVRVLPMETTETEARVQIDNPPITPTTVTTIAPRRKIEDLWQVTASPAFLSTTPGFSSI